jgi:hypothetical protein
VVATAAGVQATGAFADRLERLAIATAREAINTVAIEGMWINAAGGVIRAGQSVAVRFSSAYLKQLARAEGRNITLPEPDMSRVGQLASGIVVERASVATALRMKTEPEPARALRQARAAISRLSHAAVLDAGRLAIGDVVEAGPFKGWRWLSRGTCGACLGLDTGAVQSDGSRLVSHPGCVCVPEPTFRAERGGPARPTGVDRFRRMSKVAQDAALGPEAAQAVRAGTVTLPELVATDRVHGALVVVQQAVEQLPDAG